MAWPAVAPRETGPRSLHELLVALADVLPFGILIAGTLGGIYAGLVTTTEGATIGCILAIILGATFGNLTLRGVIDAMYSTIKFSGNILFIIFTAYVFSYAISFAGIGEKLSHLRDRQGVSSLVASALKRAGACWVIHVASVAASCSKLRTYPHAGTCVAIM